jgi:cytoskeleton protein RodZ
VSEVDAEKGMGLPVGEYLRSVRESRGLELEQASRVTKITKSYLVAIEQGEFEKLPNAAYIKGFLRLYAGYLSLSGDEIIKRYESSLPPATRPQQVESKPERRAAPSRQSPTPSPGVEIVERAKLGGPGRWVIPTLLLGLVILAAVFLTESDEQPAPPAPQPVQAPPVAAPVLPPVQPQLTSAAPVQGVAPELELPPQEVPAGQNQAGGIILRMRFKQDSWLSITIDDSISQRYDLKAGDVIEWKGARLFVLDLGDGGAVEAEFNGRPLQALGEPGKPAHVELKGQ